MFHASLLLVFATLMSPHVAEAAGSPFPPRITWNNAGAELATWDHELRLGGSARVGAQVGHVLQVPEAMVFPGAGLQLRYKVTFPQRVFAGVEAAGNAGMDEQGAPFGGYRVMGFLGATWLSWRWFQLSTEFHLGPSSYSLVPLPRAGVGNTLTFTPVNLGWLKWDASAAINTDVLLVAPSLSGTLATSLTLRVWKLFVGGDVGANAEGLVMGFANSASGTLQARAVCGVVL